MLIPTNYTVDVKLFQEALAHLPEGEMKTSINQPTGNFFYDPWIIKQEYKGTVWETLYNSLPVNKGEARIIILNPGQCYQIHADIDDRYHLNILGDKSYLINLTNETMYPLSQDGIWYDMNAGFLHTATNFGRQARVQLVVRKLLEYNQLTDPIHVIMKPKSLSLDHSRYVFDNTFSVWLNRENKNKTINNFSHNSGSVEFDVEKNLISDINAMSDNFFQVYLY